MTAVIRYLSDTSGRGRIAFAVLVAVMLLGPVAAWARDSRIVTFWPLFDYRCSAEAGYSSLNLLGPLVNLEAKDDEREFALRPLFFRAAAADGARYHEFLYPLGTAKSGPGQSVWQGLHLLEYDFGKREEGSSNEFTLFPFLFYGRQTEERDGYFAFFPLAGTIRDKLGRDEIRFTLFPLHARTRKGTRTVHNVLWPLFATIDGEGESGWKVWPLVGSSRKEGVYRKRFWLWPVFFLEEARLDTENPERRRAVFPLYLSKESPQRSVRTWLWPFFSHVEDRRRDYEEWNFPWPLVRIADGTHKEVRKFLPVYADERAGDYRKRWYLWPVYKVEETDSPQFDQRRKRILYFLYSDLKETLPGEASPRKRRVALWPLFTYESVDGVSHFHFLSLLEPFFPESEALERNWSPLWRLYQRKWDRHGNEIASLLWNLYWKERRGDDLAAELFPFFSLRRVAGEVDLSLFKGVFRYRGGAQGARLNLFYLPWAIRWGQDAG